MPRWFGCTAGPQTLRLRVLLVVGAVGAASGAAAVRGALGVRLPASMLAHTVQLWNIENMFQRAGFLAEVHTCAHST